MTSEHRKARMLEAAIRELPKLHPVTTKVVDVTDAEAFPEIAAALEYARKIKDL